TSATGVFPLRLRRQTEVQALDAPVEPLDENERVLETHTLDRTPRPSKTTRILLHYCLPKRLRAWRVEKPEAGRQFDGVLPTLVVPAPLLAFRRAHLKTPRRDPAQALRDVAKNKSGIDPVLVLAPEVRPRRRCAVQELRQVKINGERRHAFSPRRGPAGEPSRLAPRDLPARRPPFAIGEAGFLRTTPRRQACSGADPPTRS